MEKVAKTLRASREDRGRSLEEIQKATKVRTKYLKALEEGDTDSLPPGVYTRGIIRTYCQELGIDSQPLLDRYDEWKQESEQEKSLTRKLSRTPGSGNITLRNAGAARAWRAVRVVLILILVLAVGVGVYYLLQGPMWADLPLAENEQQTPNEAETPDPDKPQEPGDEEEEPTPAEPPPVEVSMEQGPGGREVTYHVSGADEVQVEISTGEPCWIRVIIDGEILQEETVPEDETRRWSTAKPMTIRLGNPAGVDMLVNGIEKGVPDPQQWWDLIFLLTDE